MARLKARLSARYCVFSFALIGLIILFSSTMRARPKVAPTLQHVLITGDGDLSQALALELQRHEVTVSIARFGPAGTEYIKFDDLAESRRQYDVVFHVVDAETSDPSISNLQCSARAKDSIYGLASLARVVYVYNNIHQCPMSRRATLTNKAMLSSLCQRGMSVLSLHLRAAASSKKAQWLAIARFLYVKVKSMAQGDCSLSSSLIDDQLTRYLPTVDPSAIDMQEKVTNGAQTNKFQQKQELRDRLVSKHNTVLARRKAQDYATFRKLAAQNDIRLYAPLQEKHFRFFSEQTSKGHDFAVFPNMDILGLMEQCQQFERCLGFTTSGYLKDRIKGDLSTASAHSDKGLYVVDNINHCEAGLHSCPKHSHCTYTTEPSPAYKCTCLEGFVAQGESLCLPQVPAMIHLVTDPLDVLDSPRNRRTAEFIFFAGKDSAFGDLAVGDPSMGVDNLKQLCRNIERCLGFNANGILKGSISPPSSWYIYSNSEGAGLYVLDVDYCSFGSQKCPQHAMCKQQGRGMYECACNPGYEIRFLSEEERQKRSQLGTQECVMSTAPDPVFVENSIKPPPEAANIVLCVDEAHYEGALALISSIYTNTQHPDQVWVHVVVVHDHSRAVEQFQDLVACKGLSDRHISVVAFDPSKLQHVAVLSDSKVVGNLASAANFARFYLDEVFPHLDLIAYIDVDTIMQGEVMDLWNHCSAGSGLVLQAVPRAQPTYGHMFSERVSDMFKKRHGYTFGPNDPTFNAGIFCLSLRQWESTHLRRDILYWMKLHKKYKLWSFGTQPLMLISLYEKWGFLPKKWNFDGLGYRTGLSDTDLDAAGILHWSGGKKPWKSDGLYRDRWLPYSGICSGRGTCNSGKCACSNGYRGKHCEDQ